ncbi:MAG: hypothetical protein KTR32_03265 [Granulosicoccus sp.]|nr:hypothetical protein [Granulosicoccus sp.]
MQRITIRLMGTVKVTGPNQEDLTPNGSKTIGLLALLAVANGESRSRSWLQEKLWSDRSPAQGQDSLRHAISKLKKSLGKHNYLLVTKGKNLSLDRGCSLIDLFDDIPTELVLPHPGQFLSGIEVKDQQFEQWLHITREELTKRNARLLNGGTRLDQSGIQIGLLPVQAMSRLEDASLVGNSLLHRLGGSLSNLGPFTIFDYSSQINTSVDQYHGPDVLLSLNCLEMGQCFSITVSVHRINDKKVVWSGDKIIPSREGLQEGLSETVIHFTDLIASVLSHPGVLGEKDSHEAARLVLAALDKIFRPSCADLASVDQSLLKATMLEEKGVYFAWHAYLQTHRLEELKGQGKQAELMDQANSLADKALQLDRNNPLSLALLTHVYAFLFRDFNRAQTLIEPAMAMKSDSVLAQDSFALLNFYVGNMDVARTAAKSVLTASMFNPYRYCFATTLCMIETVCHNYAAAAEYGEQAMSMHPPLKKERFLPTLRYLAAAQAQAGNVERAGEVYRMLKEQDPQFHYTQVESEDFPVPSKDAAATLKAGWMKIEQANVA